VEPRAEGVVGPAALCDAVINVPPEESKPYGILTTLTPLSHQLNILYPTLRTGPSFIVFKCRDSSVKQVGYGTEDQGVRIRFPERERDFYVIYNVKKKTAP
jgi:hypothetical protein